MAGSRRISAGAVRDHVLGVRAVTGKGLVFKSGGRVVKNVTGYDLSKLLSGSFGTLAVLSEVTLRVMPRPEDALTILISAVDVRAAVGMLADALACAQAVSGAAYLPGNILPTKRDLPGLKTGQGWVALRLEGFSETLPARRDALLAGLDGRKPDAILSSHQSADLWNAIGTGCLLSDPAPSMLWRVSIPPSTATEFVAAFDAGQGWRHLLDWGGGLVWLAYAGSTELTERVAASLDQTLRQSLARLGGHGALLRAPNTWRDRLNAFQPLSPVELALSRRTKAAFDPDGILNPRFMHPEL
jgi:glycolate oxidase FAD binding subunit